MAVPRYELDFQLKLAIPKLMARTTFLSLLAVLSVGCSLLPGVGGGDMPRSRGKVQYGKASWYGDKEHGNRSASGEKFSRYAFTAAHKELPFGTVVRVTNLDNGKKVKVRINDRGPFVRGRVIDLSYAAAKSVGLVRSGVAKVKVEVLSTPSTRSQSLFVSAFTVQVGSFSKRSQAKELKRRVSRVTDEGVRVEFFRFEGSSYYRVRVGRFKKRKDAEEVRRALRRRGYSGKIYVE